MIICIDSHAIIWGIKKQPSPGQESMVGKAEYFFKWADQQHEIIIPTVVLAEILSPEPTEIRTKYVEVLKLGYIIADFDTRAALKYAQILHGRLDQAKRIAESNEVVRQKMKIDHIIIAIALVNGASCIYSYDKGLRAFANGYIDVREFPEPPIKQPTLFDNETTNQQGGERYVEEKDDDPF